MAGAWWVRRGDRQGSVDPQFGDQPLAVHAVSEPIDQKCLQRAEFLCRDREPGRHGMAAAIDQQPGLARRNHRRAEQQPGDRAARPPADPVGECYDTGWALVTLLEACGDNSDHPRVPIFACREDEDR